MSYAPSYVTLQHPNVAVIYIIEMEQVLMKKITKNLFHLLQTEVHVQKTPVAAPLLVRLTCNTSCPQTDLQTAFKVYKSSISGGQNEIITNVVPISSPESFSCAVKGLKDLHSAAVCEYKPTRICSNL